MENTTPLSQLRLSMCKFHLMDGQKIDESDVPGGWKDFELKQFVEGITLADRYVSTHLTGESISRIAGFAVHWVGQMNLTTSFCGDVLREIMIVRHNGKVNVFSFNLFKKEWNDYKDDLFKPEKPHLVGYSLKTHGITL